MNALQRHATVIVQKRRAEGFGLTVTEAMWKARPVIASRVGGVQDQITHGRDGVLIDDPHNLDSLGLAIRRVVTDAELATRLGRAGRARVVDRYLADRHLLHTSELIEHLGSLEHGTPRCPGSRRPVGCHPSEPREPPMGDLGDVGLATEGGGN